MKVGVLVCIRRDKKIRNRRAFLALPDWSGVATVY